LPDSTLSAHQHIKSLLFPDKDITAYAFEVQGNPTTVGFAFYHVASTYFA
jgi:hypothetical protein